ncbi:MAG: peroxidase [Gemmatimonadales bacterium]|nr:MAG: peroxidase [Gemmatimonadales bacterium]
MSWIRRVLEDEAEGTLARVYEEIGSSRGKVSNIMRVQSLAPEAMAAHLELYRALLFGRSGLTRAERELLAVVVSVENGCEYCTLHHEAALRAWWKDDDRVDALLDDPAGAGLSTREAALVDYARRLTRNPSAMSEAGVEALRAQGLDDADILVANMIVSYFNFVNRIAEGLGVEAPPEEVEGYRY